LGRGWGRGASRVAVNGFRMRESVVEKIFPWRVIVVFGGSGFGVFGEGSGRRPTDRGPLASDGLRGDRSFRPYPLWDYSAGMGLLRLPAGCATRGGCRRVSRYRPGHAGFPQRDWSGSGIQAISGWRDPIEAFRNGTSRSSRCPSAGLTAVPCHVAACRAITTDKPTCRSNPSSGSRARVEWPAIWAGALASDCSNNRLACINPASTISWPLLAYCGRAFVHEFVGARAIPSAFVSI
jgi:hypothetical protein